MRRELINTSLSVLTQGFRVASVLIFTAWLARKLAPEDFGLVAVVTMLGNLAAMVCNMGFSAYTIQKKNAGESDYQVGFTLNVLFGLLFSIGLFLCSGYIAQVFDDDRLISVIKVASLAFLITSIGVQSKCLLDKRLKFGVVLAVDLLAVVISVSAATAVLWLTGSYWTLVVLTLSRSVLMSFGYLLVSGWLPKFCFDRSAYRESFRFGLNIGIHNWAGFIARNVDKVMVSVFFGQAALGFYENAYKFMLFPISNLRQPVMRVLLPTLSAAKTGEDSRYRYRTVHKMLTYSVVPSMMFLACNAEWTVELILGPGWDLTASLFGILALVGAIQPLVTSTGVVMLSQDRSKSYRHWGIAYAIGSVISMVIGVAFGVKGLAFGYLLFNWITSYWFVRYSFEGSALRQIDFWGAVLIAFIATLPCIIIDLYLNLNIVALFAVWLSFPLWVMVFDKEIRVFVRKLISQRINKKGDQ